MVETTWNVDSPKVVPATAFGRRFRSTTEARWATCLTAMGVPWEYEAETYDLGPLGWYLPDFWLPTLDMFLEVKPSRDATADEVAKVQALADRPGRRAAIAHGFGMPIDWFEGRAGFVTVDVSDDDSLHFEHAPGWLEVYRLGGRLSGSALCRCRCGVVALEWDQHWWDRDGHTADRRATEQAYAEGAAFRPDSR